MQSLQPGQALQLHLQQVVSAELALQMLDGADTPGGERRVSRQGKRGETHCWGHGVLGPGQPASPAPRRDHRVGEMPSLRARPGTHPPQAPGHHDGHAVAHGLRLGHGVGGQQGAPRRVSNGGPDQLPEVRPRKININQWGCSRRCENNITAFPRALMKQRANSDSLLKDRRFAGTTGMERTKQTGCLTQSRASAECRE